MGSKRGCILIIQSSRSLNEMNGDVRSAEAGLEKDGVLTKLHEVVFRLNETICWWCPERLSLCSNSTSHLLSISVPSSFFLSSLFSFPRPLAISCAISSAISFFLEPGIAGSCIFLRNVTCLWKSCHSADSSCFFCHVSGIYFRALGSERRLYMESYARVERAESICRVALWDFLEGVRDVRCSGVDDEGAVVVGIRSEWGDLLLMIDL